MTCILSCVSFLSGAHLVLCLVAKLFLLFLLRYSWNLRTAWMLSCLKQFQHQKQQKLEQALIFLKNWHNDSFFELWNPQKKVVLHN